MPKAKAQHGTAYRFGGLSCGCVRSLTGPEVQAAEPEEPVAGCIRGDSKPRKCLVLWVALPGVRVRPHRCCDGPTPSPPGCSELPTLPEVRIPIEEIENPSCALKDVQTGTAEVPTSEAAFCEMKGGQIAWQL